MRFNLDENGMIREIGDQSEYKYEVPEGQNIGHHNFDKIRFLWDKDGKLLMENGMYHVEIVDSPL